LHVTWPTLHDLKSPAKKQKSVSTMETAETQLLKCLERVNASTEANGLSFAENGTFAKNLSSVYGFFMSNIYAGAGREMVCESALYICGVPGVGKTSGVRLCSEKAVEATRRDSSLEGCEPIICHVNAGHLGSSKNAEKLLFEKIATAMGLKTASKVGLLRALKGKGRSMVFLILDEIDVLVSAKQARDERQVNSEKLLQALLEWSRDSTMRFAVVGISNAICNVMYDRLHRVGSVSFFGMAYRVRIVTFANKIFCSVSKDDHVQCL
jgi:Cdc6-like AAA superfamily ATPase